MFLLKKNLIFKSEIAMNTNKVMNVSSAITKLMSKTAYVEAIKRKSKTALSIKLQIPVKCVIWNYPVLIKLIVGKSKITIWTVEFLIIPYHVKDASLVSNWTEIYFYKISKKTTRNSSFTLNSGKINISISFTTPKFVNSNMILRIAKFWIMKRNVKNANPSTNRL